MVASYSYNCIIIKTMGDQQQSLVGPLTVAVSNLNELSLSMTMFSELSTGVRPTCQGIIAIARC